MSNFTKFLETIRGEVYIYTSTGKHAIQDTEQCADCHVLDDPDNMYEIDGYPYCLECAIKRY